tara:strand:- start:2435 stop:6028 length:3594 start_codon:yes stop_codon:yes gene_type:complete
MVSVFKIENPFDPSLTSEKVYEEGVTLDDVGAAYKDAPWLCEVHIAGKKYYPLRSEWGNIELQDGDCVYFVPKVEGTTVLLILSIVSVAISVVVATRAKPKIPSIRQPVQPSLGVANILPSASSQGASEADPVFLLRGQKNQNRLNSPIEDAYGRVRHFPSYAAAAYNQFLGNDQYQYQLFSLGHGSHVVEVPHFEDTPFTNFSDVEYEIYQPGEAVTLFPDNVVTSVEVGGIELLGPNEVGFAVVGPFAANASGTTTSHLEVDVTLPSGLYFSNDLGGLQTVNVLAKWEMRLIDDLGTPLGDWATLADFTKTLATVTPQRFTLQADVPEGRYEVRGERLDDNSASHRVGDTVEWSGMRAFLTPTRDYGDLTLLAVKARATNNLNDRSSNRVNVFATRKLPNYDAETGTLAAVDDLVNRTASTNPVWAAIQIFRAKYGANQSDDSFDLTTLAAEAAVAETEGIEFSWVFDSKLTCWEAAKLALFTFKAAPVFKGSKISMWRDKPAELPKFFINAENTFAGSFLLERKLIDKQENDGLEVTYTDPITWKPEVVLCLLPGQSGINPKKLLLHGVTDRQRAFDLGIYHWARGSYERTQVSLKTGLEGHIPSYGTLGRISSDVPRWGSSGYVTSISGMAVNLSEPVTFSDAVHQIAFRGKLGQDVGPFTVTPGADLNQVILSGSPDLSQLVFSQQGEPPFFVFGISNNVGKLCRIERLTPTDGEAVKMTAIVDDQRRHIDYGVAPAAATNPTPPTIPDAPTVTGLSVVAVPGTLTFVQASWQPALGAVNYIIEQSTDGANWEAVDTISSTSYTLSVLPGFIWVRVAAVNVGIGLFDVWSGTVGSPTTVPDNVTGLAVSPAFTGAFCALSWNGVSNATSYIVEIWTAGVLRTSSEVSTLSFTWTIDAAEADDEPETVDRDITFKLYGKNAVGLSELSNDLAVSNPVPAVPTGVSSVLKSSGADYQIHTFSWDIVSGTDISKYNLYGSTTSGFTPGPSNLLYSGLVSGADVQIDEGAGYEDLYWVVSAVDVWGDDINPSAEQTIVLADVLNNFTSSSSGWGTSFVEMDGVLAGDFELTFTPGVTGFRYFGLNTSSFPTRNSSYSSNIEHAFYCQNGTTLNVRESGTLRDTGTYSPTDLMMIKRVGSVMTWHKNGGLALYTNSSAPTVDLLASGTFYTSGCQIMDLKVDGVARAFVNALAGTIS